MVCLRHSYTRARYLLLVAVLGRRLGSMDLWSEPMGSMVFGLMVIFISCASDKMCGILVLLKKC